MRQDSFKLIAKQRIAILFEEAKKTYETNPKLAVRHVKSARRIAMAARLRLPVGFKRETCRRCNALLVQGRNCRVRVKQKREPHVVITCLSCGYQSRIKLNKKMEQKPSEQNNNKNEAPC